uniref:BZIP domain-containing protein n=1 Tax=Macrostomum lignano TaxID=282301 RepID=A0A1I8IY83_9PLAT
TALPASGVPDPAVPGAVGTAASSVASCSTFSAEVAAAACTDEGRLTLVEVLPAVAAVESIGTGAEGSRSEDGSEWTPNVRDTILQRRSWLARRRERSWLGRALRWTQLNAKSLRDEIVYLKHMKRTLKKQQRREFKKAKRLEKQQQESSKRSPAVACRFCCRICFCWLPHCGRTRLEPGLPDGHSGVIRVDLEKLNHYKGGRSITDTDCPPRQAQRVIRQVSRLPQLSSCPVGGGQRLLRCPDRTRIFVRSAGDDANGCRGGANATGRPLEDGRGVSGLRRLQGSAGERIGDPGILELGGGPATGDLGGWPSNWGSGNLGGRCWPSNWGSGNLGGRCWPSNWGSGNLGGRCWPSNWGSGNLGGRRWPSNWGSGNLGGRRWPSNWGSGKAGSATEDPGGWLSNLRIWEAGGSATKDLGAGSATGDLGGWPSNWGSGKLAQKLRIWEVGPATEDLGGWPSN